MQWCMEKKCFKLNGKKKNDMNKSLFYKQEWAYQGWTWQKRVQQSSTHDEKAMLIGKVEILLVQVISTQTAAWKLDILANRWKQNENYF